MNKKIYRINRIYLIEKNKLAFPLSRGKIKDKSASSNIEKLPKNNIHQNISG